MDNENTIKKINIEEKENSDLFLRKHVGLIHCENKLSLIQRKICNILLFNALDKIKEQEIHEIPLRQLCSLIGYNSNATKQIKEAIKGLISLVIEWNLLDDKKFLSEKDYHETAISWNASSLLAGATIKEGIVQYSYSPQIKSVLSDLDIYGRINLFVQAKFNSSYSLVLYENCVRFKNIKKTAWFPIDLFRLLMGVSGEKYTQFKEFNRCVINVAIEEVNQKSDIHITPQFKKSGKNIRAIQFVIKENDAFAPVFRKRNSTYAKNTNLQQQSNIIEILITQFMLSEKQSKDLVSSYTQEYILEKITFVKTKKNIDNMGAYLISALKNDFKNKTDNIYPNNGKRQTDYVREMKEASEIDFLKQKYAAYRNKQCMNTLEQQNENIKNSILDQFENSIRAEFYIFDTYKKRKFDSTIIMHSFIKFLKDNYSYIISDIKTFEEYIISEVDTVEIN